MLGPKAAGTESGRLGPRINRARNERAGGATIDLVDVHKMYDAEGGSIEAIQGVSTRIEAQEFVSIVGPSGCGKTTLLFIIAGLERASSGEILVNDAPVVAPVRDVGVVFQRDLLLEWRTCLENVMLQFELRGVKPTKRDRDNAHSLLASVGMDDFAGRRPRRLSGGMRQRVSICRALVHQPPLVLMDEPFGALDALTREELNIELERVTRQTTATVVFVTHSIEEAVHLSDRVLVMSPRPSRIVADVRISLERPRTAAVREDEAFAAYVAEIRRYLIDSGGISAA